MAFPKYERYNDSGVVRGGIISLRSLEAVTAEILQLEQETEGLLKRLVSFGGGDDG
ncbi:MAG: hypothetical protein NW220_15770 [Leptolyngbyaceae cyanobacterium bins.349]|nr:hypothetical protein [Leptolyngbyaceae cyanobacterium bins.349]